MDRFTIVGQLLWSKARIAQKYFPSIAKSYREKWHAEKLSEGIKDIREFKWLPNFKDVKVFIHVLGAK